MKGKIVIWSLLLLWVVACDNTSIKTIQLRSYIGTEDIEAPYMRFPYRVEISDGLLFAFDMASDSMFYHVFTYPDMAYLYSLGKKGNAPEEIILPTPFQCYKDEIQILDGARAMLYSYRCISKERPVLSYSYPIELPRVIDFVRVNDSVLIVEDFSGESRLIKVTPSKKEPLYSIPQNGRENSKTNASDAYLWRSFMSYNSAFKKLAMATQSGDVVEIYDMANGGSIVTVGDGGMPRNANQLEGFHDIHWIGDKIYALYSGRLREDLSRSFSVGKREPDGGDKIRVYSSDGKLLEQYQLDCFINGFTFDKEKQRLIGITSNRDNPFCFFDLK